MREYHGDGTEMGRKRKKEEAMTGKAGVAETYVQVNECEGLRQPYFYVFALALTHL